MHTNNDEELGHSKKKREKLKQYLHLNPSVAIFTLHCGVLGIYSPNACCDVGSMVAMEMAFPAEHCGVLHRDMYMDCHVR